KRSDAGPLTLQVAVSGAEITPSGLGALLRVGDERLRYTAPFAIDAGGRTLPVRLGVRPGRLTLRVDDSGARYPVTVDPYVQRAVLTSSEDGLGLGVSVPVGISGDTV